MMPFTDSTYSGTAKDPSSFFLGSPAGSESHFLSIPSTSFAIWSPPQHSRHLHFLRNHRKLAPSLDARHVYPMTNFTPTLSLPTSMAAHHPPLQPTNGRGFSTGSTTFLPDNSKTRFIRSTIPSSTFFIVCLQNNTGLYSDLTLTVRWKLSILFSIVLLLQIYTTWFNQFFPRCLPKHSLLLIFMVGDHGNTSSMTIQK